MGETAFVIVGEDEGSEDDGMLVGLQEGQFVGFEEGAVVGFDV